MTQEERKEGRREEKWSPLLTLSSGGSGIWAQRLSGEMIRIPRRTRRHWAVNQQSIQVPGVETGPERQSLEFSGLEQCVVHPSWRKERFERSCPPLDGTSLVLHVENQWRSKTTFQESVLLVLWSLPWGNEGWVCSVSLLSAPLPHVRTHMHNQAITGNFIGPAVADGSVTDDCINAVVFQRGDSGAAPASDEWFIWSFSRAAAGPKSL